MGTVVFAVTRRVRGLVKTTVPIYFSRYTLLRPSEISARKIGAHKGGFMSESTGGFSN